MRSLVLSVFICVYLWLKIFLPVCHYKDSGEVLRSKLWVPGHTSRRRRSRIAAGGQRAGIHRRTRRWLRASWRARPTASSNCRVPATLALGLRLRRDGSAMAARMPMIAMTVSSSRRVKAKEVRSAECGVRSAWQRGAWSVEHDMGFRIPYSAFRIPHCEGAGFTIIASSSGCCLCWRPRWPCCRR